MKTTPSTDPRPLSHVCDEMRAHFQRHGFYRPADVARLLGDPRDSVSMSCSPPVLLPLH